VTIANVPN